MARDLRARLEFQRASIRGRAGDLTTARAALDEVRANLGAFSDREQASVLMLAGMVEAELAQPAAAARTFSAAAAVAAQLGDTGAELTARHNEAYALYLTGDLPAALALMSASAAASEHISTPVALLDRALVLLAAGLVDDATEHLVRAREGRVGRGWRIDAEIDLELAHAHRLAGRATDAAAAARRARRRYERHGATAWAARAHLLQLELALDRGRATPAMAATAAHVGHAAGALGDIALADRAATVAAEVWCRRGCWDRAAEVLTAAAGRATRSLEGDLHRFHVVGLVQAGQGQRATARRTLARGARLVTVGQRGSASLDLRTAVAVHGVRLADLDLDLALTVGPAAVLASLDRWRSATDRLPRLRPPADPHLAGLTTELRGELDRARSEADPDRLRRSARRTEDLQARIRELDWARVHTPDRADQRPARDRPRDVLEALGRDLLWFTPHRGRMLGVGLIGGRCTIRDLAAADEVAELSRRLRADLKMATTVHLGGLRAAVWGSFAAAATTLDRLLVAPWPSRSAGLVVVPCHDLSGLPWAAFPSLAGRPLTVARSLTGFTSRSRAVPAPVTVHTTVGPRLARAGEEAAAVRATWRAVPEVAHVVPAAPSSAARLVRAVTTADLVHVAAHGRHVAQSPLFSSVDLDDGPLFAHEFQPLGVQAGHVVLSACDVGTSTVRPGEELLGLAASLYSLGAASVVGAVSPVPDDVAAAVMGAHHRHLAAGRPSDEALALAVSASDPVAASFQCLGAQWRLAH